MTIRRFSSRTHRLDSTVLLEHLKGARSYKRIAGYFTSSLFEVANELLEEIPVVQIVCNVDVQPQDLQIAQLREARLMGRWNEKMQAADALLQRQRYRRLNAFLEKHGQAVRVAPDNVCGFLHGKAGVIERADGTKIGFMGSMNETRSGWQQHYEILWEDSSPEGVRWIEEEFAYLWQNARPLPELVIKEVRRSSKRREVSFMDVQEEDELAPAALVESPLYREGFSLQPWQQGFVSECLRHYKMHGRVRLLLADEVGLGKTLSMATAALTLCLLASREQTKIKPIVIFAPATLCEQWQTEMMDKLGIPSARWDTQKKVWLGTDERPMSPEGRDQIAKCPLRIGIVSTGLMMRDSQEKRHLLGLRFNTVVLDEAHKARSRQGFGSNAGTPNELLAFMRQVAALSDHVLLGTATPIQTRPEDLWDLMSILHQGDGNFVLGNDYSPWHRPDTVLPILSGQQTVSKVEEAWHFLRSPLPQVDSTNDQRARLVYRDIRDELQLRDSEWETNLPYTNLPMYLRDLMEEELERDVNGTSFFQRDNPLVRHVVLRKRTSLENEGLLEKVGVDVHPDRERVRNLQRFDGLFEGKGLRTEDDFREAYKYAREFGKALSQGGKGGGFMKNLMEQRICSSIHAGLNTAKMLLAGRTIEVEDDDDVTEFKLEGSAEIGILNRLIERLEKIDKDPKLAAVLHYLNGEGWLQHGVIIFSQYYDTARWVAERLAEHYPKEAVGLYAGASRSRLYQEGESITVERELLKKQVAEHAIRIMVATDAACEGLNLQTLGTLINIDLPWNPTRLEQRIGRIKRFGQKRRVVDMLNLVHEQTVDEKIYERLSERMESRYNLFGSVPDTIKDEWIENIETLGEKMDEYINDQRQANGFDLRYTDTMHSPEQDWRECADVLSRRDFAELMSNGWGGKQYQPQAENLDLKL